MGSRRRHALVLVPIAVVLVALLVCGGLATFGDSRAAVFTDSSSASPSPRWGAQMAYDPIGGYTLLFSGSSGAVTQHGIRYGDTWTYRSGTWTDITPAACTNATCPRAEAYGGLSFYNKSGSSYLVLYGGRVASLLTDSTWIFNGSWHNVTPSHLVPGSNSPPALNYVAMTWDARDGYDLLYGGCSIDCKPGSASEHETWAFKGLNLRGKAVWRNLTGAVHPPGLYSEGLTYDAADHYVLLFGGGEFGTETYLNQTWSYTGATGWVDRTAAVVNRSNTPPFEGIIPEQLQYDPAKGYVLLFSGQHFWASPTGGDKTANATTNETWSYRAGIWTNITQASSPHPRFGAAMTFDSADQVVLLFGGLGGTEVSPPLLGDTWWFNGTWTNRTLP